MVFSFPWDLTWVLRVPKQAVTAGAQPGAHSIPQTPRSTLTESLECLEVDYPPQEATLVTDGST